MLVINHSALPRDPPDGPNPRVGVAGFAQGIRGFEAFTQQLEPGASTGTRHHDGELAILVLQGSGKLQLPDGPQRFQAPCTLVVPPGAEHQVVNHGGGLLQLVTVAAPPKGVAPR
ncbi:MULTISPECIES: cupin domain-containing protein [unclassified Rhizobacter]|uniref:cupin domain-containing protein n=1 Tax=unclassified Rhizobacter TaxID=2640088 RepID=UPI000AF2B46D|nr:MULTISPECIES: cupin domain-containing protein [unclassified Rhizobacter]